MLGIQGNVGQKISMGHAPNDSVTSSTLVQNVKKNTEEPAVNSIKITPQKTIQSTKQLPTPIKHSILSEFLTGYDDDEVKFLINGFKFGFNLGYQGERVSRQSRNLVSCFQKPEVVQKKLEKEIALGRIAGPFLEPPFRTQR